MSKNVKRLFSQFAPEHYTISITLSADKKSFHGTLSVVGQKKGRPSNRITLHQKGLRVSDAHITYIDKKGSRHPIEHTRTVLQKTFDEVRIHSQAALHAGTYEVDLTFNGTITKNMEGIYPCFYSDNGIDNQLLATQFESHHAREAFPCIDEPEAKATFQLSLTHAKNEIALSNTMPTEETEHEHTTTTVFETTPRMSTYLLAFVVGDLRMKETKSNSGVRIRTFATPHQIEHTKFALQEAAEYMDFYEEYYDIPFPLKKCDFVALPDFASGAMENWGLITFREQTLLVDPHTSLSTKQFVAIVVAHELTHQWFGNLVTMRWWTDLWLNEGFASWMEYLAVDNRHPEWHLWTQFAVSEQQLALKMDALEHTHPIEVPVKHPDEIRTIFDTISYQKGASVIHMLHDYLGDTDFRDGLRHYLKTHAYKNTDTVDLWQALEDVSGKPVKSFMHQWTSLSGFPLVTVTAAAGKLTATQQRFVTNPSSPSRTDTHIWPVPLLANGLHSTTLHTSSENISLQHSNAPIKINVGQTGFYRVDYSHDIQAAQIEALERGEISEIDRMGLLADGFEVTKAGYQSVSEYLELLQSFHAEDSLPVWEIIAGSLGSIISVLSPNDHDESLRDLAKPFIRSFIAIQLQRLGLSEHQNESHLDTLLRPIIAGMAANADHPDTVDKFLTLYRSKIDKNTHINPDLRDSIYTTSARLGGLKEYDELWDLYQRTTSSDEKLSIAAAMTSFKQPELHDKVLKLLRDEKVKFQDVPYWIAYSMMNRHAKAATWDWMKNHWKWLKMHMGNDLSFSRFPIYAARTFNTETHMHEYTTFFSEHMEPMIERTYSQGLEMIQTSVAWHTRDSNAAIQWFTDASA